MSRIRSRAGTAVVFAAMLCGVVLRARSAGAQGAPVTDLQTALDRLKPRSPVALQIERKGQLTFLAFELD